MREWHANVRHTIATVAALSLIVRAPASKPTAFALETILSESRRLARLARIKFCGSEVTFPPELFLQLSDSS
jgi:hypothetical protein